MTQRKKTKYVHEGQYVAEVEIEVIEDDSGWSPHMSIEDAFKLDDAKVALRQGDLNLAATFGKIYQLHPVETERR